MQSNAPLGDELEDLAATIVAASGYYVSQRLVQRPYGEDEVLELDVLGTRLTRHAGIATAHRVTVEAKSGTAWGYTQVFKLLGQKAYLHADHALFVVSGCDPKRVELVDDRFREFDLHAVFVPGPVSAADTWQLWRDLADRGLLSSSIPPASLTAAMARTTRRRQADDELRRSVRKPGHSPTLADAAALLKATDDVGLMVADPVARLLALWSMRARWQGLGQRAAEEESQGIGGSTRSVDGERIIDEACRREAAHPLIQSMLLAGLRVQLDLILALAEVAIGTSSLTSPPRLPAAIRRATGSLHTLPATPQLPWLAQQAVWRWGGVLRRTDLRDLAAEADVSPDDAFAVLNVIGQLFRNWKTAMPAEETLRRRNQRREEALLAAPVVEVRGAPALLRLPVPPVRKRTPPSRVRGSAPSAP